MTTVGSLCSGYGGLEMGLALGLGVELRHAWHVEYDKHPAAILAHRFPGVPNYGDVKTLPYGEMEPIDWLSAGYPCQPFSSAGRRLGEADVRHLWPYVADAIGTLRPRNVLLENVRGHLRRGFDSVLADLAALGYDARWGVVRASLVGAPHRRERIFVVASAADEPSAGQLRAEQLEDSRGSGTGRGPGHAGEASPVGVGGTAVATSSNPNELGHERGWGTRDGWAGSADSRVTPSDAHGERFKGVGRLDTLGRDADGRRGQDVAWGTYEPAIRRWEQATGRCAPNPTEPAQRGTGRRLSPRFVEWMMGLPAGWVTDVPGLPRNAQLKALGNGVVPQQAALAVRLLTAQAQEVAA